jgi:hypothetical protein
MASLDVVPEQRSRRRRRAVGPPGAARPTEPLSGLLGVPSDHEPADRAQADDEREDARLRADRPPHHDQGV